MMGRGGGQGQGLGTCSGALGNVGPWEGAAYLTGKVKEKSELRRRMVCGKWNTNVPSLGFFLSSKTGPLDFPADPVPSYI